MATKYVKRRIFGVSTASKKELIKEVKQIHHKMLFRIPISLSEIEKAARNPYFDIGYNCAWESTNDRINRICENRVIKELLYNENGKGQKEIWLEQNS